MARLPRTIKLITRLETNLSEIQIMLEQATQQLDEFLNTINKIREFEIEVDIGPVEEKEADVDV